MSGDDAKRLKKLETENAMLKATAGRRAGEERSVERDRQGKMVSPLMKRAYFVNTDCGWTTLQTWSSDYEIDFDTRKLTPLLDHPNSSLLGAG